MIAQVYEETVRLWTPDSEAALRQCGQAAAYGTDLPFLRFYADDHGNRLSLFDGAASLHAVGDIEEMLLFLTMDPSVRAVRTDAETARRLAVMWEAPLETEAVMRAPENAVSQGTAELTALRDIYDVLTEGFGHNVMPPFEMWYADVHHRYRRGRCRAVSVKEDGVPQACAMTVSECDSAALIGAVATRPTARGKGYASSCVLQLASMLQNEGKTVWLSPKNAYAHALYERLGFSTVGEWGSVKR